MTRSNRELRAADTTGLLDMTRAGDRGAYDELFVRYRRFATGVAHRQRAVDVDEAVAEAFRRTMSAIDNDKGPTSAFGPYLATAIRSVIAEQRRRTKRERAAGTGEDLLGSESTMMDSADVDPALAEAFSTLPERWKNVIWYTDVEGFASREVAKMLGVRSSNAVSSLRSRAQLGLRAAYLATLAGEAHTHEVQEYLTALIDGGRNEADLIEAVRWHLEECDECFDLAGKIAALTGGQLPMLLAPAVLAGFGFGADMTLLPPRARFEIGQAAGVAAAGGVLAVLSMRGGRASVAAAAALVVAVAAGGLLIVTGSGESSEPIFSGSGSGPVATSPAPEPEPDNEPTPASPDVDESAAPPIATPPANADDDAPVAASTTSTTVIDPVDTSPSPQTTTRPAVQPPRQPATTSAPTTARPATTAPVTTASDAAATTTAVATTTTAAPTTTRAPTTTAAPTTTRAPTTTAASTTTEPPATTAAPTTTEQPATTFAPTTTKPPATTIAPTTTKPPATTIAPVTTTVVTTTAAATPFSGRLVTQWQNPDGTLEFEVRVTGLDGRPGSLAFSRPIKSTGTVLATCSSQTRCDFNGVAGPAEVVIRGVAESPLLVTLLDGSGNVVATATLD